MSVQVGTTNHNSDIVDNGANMPRVPDDAASVEQQMMLRDIDAALARIEIASKLERQALDALLERLSRRAV